ncbi:MAG: hypothetical protein CMJ58_27140 [Planctomycetaceae bacterium]|nr:hypothetical protein [Planctomycetaceae bacterium]
MTTRFAILGAGSGGLSLARKLRRFDDVEVDVYEASDRVGGLQYSAEHDGVHYDVGLFLFHEGHELLETFPSIQPEFVPIEYKPLSITPNGGYDRYPFSIGGFVRDNGLFRTGLAAADLLVSKALNWQRNTVPRYAKYYTGGTIYRRSGLQKYIHRLHDAPDTEIDVYFAERRLHVLGRQSLRRLAAKAFSRGYRKQATSSFRQRLVRPPQGIDYFYDQILEDVRRHGAEVHLGTAVESVARSGGEFTVTSNLGERKYDRVISTIPMPAMLRLIGRTPAVEIENRDLISLFYTGKFRNPGNAFFNFTMSGRWKRITVFSKFYGPHRGQDYFTVEVTSQDTSPAAVEAACRDFEDHAREFNLLEGSPELQGTFVTPRAYPLYRAGQLAAVEREKQHLRDFGIDLVGRQGNYEYIISDVVAQRAETLVEQIGDDLKLASAKSEEMVAT